MNKISISVVTIIFAALAGTYAFQKFSGYPRETACTQEAKLCPDGSAVGRTGPNCEFAPCPVDALCEGGECANSSWKTRDDYEEGVSFRYPDPLPTTYISAQDWPPVVQVIHRIFSCVEKTRTVNGKTYCVQSENGAAAGTMYTRYVYATPGTRENEITILGFTIRAVQCGNYSDPEKTECEREQASFDLDEFVDRIVATVTVH